MEEKKNDFEKIYSTIKQLKEKYKKDKENLSTNFSLGNYNLSKVTSDEKLKDVLLMLEPNYYQTKVITEQKNENQKNIKQIFSIVNEFNDRSKRNTGMSEIANVQLFSRSANSNNFKPVKRQVSNDFTMTKTKSTKPSIHNSKNITKKYVSIFNDPTLKIIKGNINKSSISIQKSPLIFDSASFVKNTSNSTPPIKYTRSFYTKEIEDLSDKLATVCQFNQGKRRLKTRRQRKLFI